MKSATGKQFWTGGFRHELQAQWSWCTKDSPEMIDQTILPSMAVAITVAGVRTGRTELDDMNCLSITYEASYGIAISLCNSSNIYLSCESVEKYPSELLVRVP
jgi:hypothetical protein